MRQESAAIPPIVPHYSYQSVHTECAPSFTLSSLHLFFRQTAGQNEGFDTCGVAANVHVQGHEALVHFKLTLVDIQHPEPSLLSKKTSQYKLA